MSNKKVNQLARKFGATLCQIGIGMLQKAFCIKTKKISSRELKNFLVNLLEIERDRVVLHDGEYYLTDWEIWRELIKWDWTDQKQYLADRYDCDNFAESFKSRMAEIYDLNSAGRFSVKIFRVDSGREVGYHRANIIVAYDVKGGLKAYAYDSMYGMEDKWSLIEKGKPIIIKNWRYEPRFISFN